MSPNLKSQFRVIRHNFEIFSKLAAMYDEWVLEYTHRVELDVNDVQNLDETLVRNVRNTDEKFSHLLPEVNENEMKWEKMLRQRLADLKKRMKYVVDHRKILQSNINRFKESIAACPSAEERANYTQLLNELGPLPRVDVGEFC